MSAVTKPWAGVLGEDASMPTGRQLYLQIPLTGRNVKERTIAASVSGDDLQLVFGDGGPAIKLQAIPATMLKAATLNGCVLLHEVPTLSREAFPVKDGHCYWAKLGGAK